MKQQSEELEIMIICGIPKVAEGKLFNAALAFNDGKLIGQYRKCHLFDVDIPGGITHIESNTFGASNDYCIFDSQYGRYGLGICYDIRFPIFFQLMGIAKQSQSTRQVKLMLQMLKHKILFQ